MNQNHKCVLSNAYMLTLSTLCGYNCAKDGVFIQLLMVRHGGCLLFEGVSDTEFFFNDYGEKEDKDSMLQKKNESQEKDLVV